LIVEINAKEFVGWLFSLPVKKLMKPVRANDAIAVARRLAELANSEPELNFLWGLAADIWKFLIHIPDGRVATNEQCSRFLDEFGPYFPAHDLKAVQRAIENAAQVEVPKMCHNPNQLEYRIERPVPYAPFLTYGPRRSKRPLADDISERIGVAIDAMTEAKCSRPVASVADALRRSGLLPGEYCTVPHVTSRSKSLGARIPLSQQESPDWLMPYWLKLYPEYVSKNVADPEWPERFVFMKCDC
jgi:hypothetical protein